MHGQTMINYKSNRCKHAYGETCMQGHLFEHFCENDHVDFLCDVSITFIDKTNPSNPLNAKINEYIFLKYLRLLDLI